MLKVTIFVTILAVAYASSDAEWHVFKHKHKKTYVGDEETIRRYIWETNKMKIQEHNERFAQGKSSFYLAENEYADMTTDEVVRYMNGFKPIDPLPVSEVEEDTDYPEEDLPKKVDWREKGYVTPVKNQGKCGSCWAFSATGSLEGQHYRATGELKSLSESNLMDCSQRWGNHGCHGGLMDNAFDYVIKNRGIDTEESYPYEPKDQSCRFERRNVGATEKSYKDVKHGSEHHLKEAAAKVGPISVAIDAGHASFQLYGGGVYDEPKCSSTKLDHGVLVVGYGKKDDQAYWLVKNSWGDSWGEKGYIKMSRDKNNQCGIATSASYPIV